jgi:DNA-binding CsgD family transcriptional regulator/pimeloyl-ACP methyl ester carboxylesterase
MDVSIRYARTLDDVSIAYWSVGNGPPLVLMPGLTSHVRVDIAARRKLYERLSAHHQLIRYDGRGQGMSARVESEFSFETATLDLLAVTEDLELDRFALCAVALGCPSAIHFAATQPERLTHLILWNSFARASDYFCSPLTELLPLAESHWDVFTMMAAHLRFGWENSRLSREMASLVQNSIDSRFFQAMVRAADRLDASESLSQVRTPTLVIHRYDYDADGAELSEAVASAIPHAQMTIYGENERSALAEEIMRFVGTMPDGTEKSFGMPVYLRNRSRDLTTREIQILRLLANGRHNKEIAAELSLSVNTVERHIATIYAKAGVHGRVEAARYAAQSGLITDPDTPAFH